MHPLRERSCDNLLEHPGLCSPPPEPETPRPPRVRKPRVFKLAPRFPLQTKEQYEKWCTHQKELQMMKPKVNANPPNLFPELYLKPRRLDQYAHQLEANMAVNKELLKRINIIQRTGGYVDCRRPEPSSWYNRMLCQQRQLAINKIQSKNAQFYSRLHTAIGISHRCDSEEKIILYWRSEQPLTEELNESWKDTKKKLIMQAQLPFILFKTDKIDRDMRDPAFNRPQGFVRTGVKLELEISGGAKMGNVTVELFNDVVPETCRLFIGLVRGDSRGYAYTKTRIFRIVPGLYCRGGDVCKDNGFGCYVPEGEFETIAPENFDLDHSVPGVMSMVVTADANEVCGQFNIIFKPLVQFDGKHVVFGRIVAGPPQTLERISALGRPLGTVTEDVIISRIAYRLRGRPTQEGAISTVTFPPRRRKISC